MTDKELNDLKLHVAGATVRHVNPFNNLEVYRNDFELDQKFIDKFVIPYYMDIPRTVEDQAGILQFGQTRKEFTSDVIKTLLGNFDWRTRQTGAFFAAVNEHKEFEDTIGRLLLKSEVCYAGQIYSLVPASFNSKTARQYLTEYLNYYLTKPNLHFDQIDALIAIKYLDEENGTNDFELLEGKWTQFLNARSDSDKEIGTEGLRDQIITIKAIQKYAC